MVFTEEVYNLNKGRKTKQETEKEGKGLRGHQSHYRCFGFCIKFKLIRDYSPHDIKTSQTSTLTKFLEIVVTDTLLVW